MLSGCPGEAYGALFPWLRMFLVLEHLPKPLSASARQLPGGQPSVRDIGASPDNGYFVFVLGQRLGEHALLCPHVVGLFLTLHALFLQHMRDLAQLVVHEYSRKRDIRSASRELARNMSVHAPLSRTIPCLPI